ncbi:hypothetical protein BGZ75_002314 [Mortierella antarctica]|nr:hypothetical protein BGZ75_002314 [Mortierella antarctica]
MLDNLELVLEKPEDRERLTDAIILGADPGEINPLVIAKLDPRQPNERHIVKITRKMHYHFINNHIITSQHINQHINQHDSQQTPFILPIIMGIEEELGSQKSSKVTDRLVD